MIEQKTDQIFGVSKISNGSPDSANYYKSILETLNSGIIVIDAETLKIVEVNKFLTDLTGCAPEDLLDRELWATGLFENNTAYTLVGDLLVRENLTGIVLPLETGRNEARRVEFSGRTFRQQNRKFLLCNILEISREEQSDKKNERLTKELLDIRFALDTSSIVAITDRKGKIKYVNDKFCEISGYAREELIGKDHRLINSSHHSKGFIESLWKTISSGKVWTGEIKNRRKDGSFYWVDTTIVPFLDEKGNPYQYVSIRNDITQRKRAEENLRESEERFRCLADTAPVLIWMSGRDKQCNYFNKSWLDFTGRTLAEELGSGWTEGVHPEDFERCLEVYNASFDARREFEMEYRLRRFDGEYRWILDRGSPRATPDGEFLGYIGSCTDIHDRKQGEELVYQKAKQLFLVADTAPVFIAHLDRELRFKFVNKPYAARFGLKPEDCVGRIFHEIVGQETVKPLQKYFETVLSGKPVEFEIEIPYAGIGAHFMHCSYAPEFDRDGNVVGFVAANTDISERRKIEDALRDSEQKFQALVKTSAQIVWETNARGEVEADSPTWREFTGQGLEQWRGTGWVDAVHPDDRQYMQNRWQNALKMKKPMKAKFRLRHRSRGWRWVTVRATPMIGADGSIQKWVGMNTDITERRKAGEKLRKSEERLRLALEGARAGVWEHSYKKEFLYASRQVREMFGFTENEAITAEMWQSRTHPEDILPLREKMREALKSGASEWRLEFRVLHPERGVRWIQNLARISRDENGRADKVVGINLDITEMKTAEEEIRRSEAAFRTIAEAAPAFVWVCSANGELIYMNERWFEFSGQTIEEAVGYGWAQMMHPDDAARTLPIWERCRETGEVYENEGRYRRKDGVYRWHKFRALPRRNAEGAIETWYGISFDIHDAKIAEEKVRESETRFRNMADHAPVMVWVTDAKGYCHFLSQSWYDLTGETPETSLGFDWLKSVHPDDEKSAKYVFFTANEKGEPFHLEYRLRRRDGEYRWMLDSAQPRFSETGDFLGYIGSVLDITDRKRAEETVKASEAHLRRVLNNLFAFVAVLKPDGTLIEVNQPPLDISGQQFEDVVGKKFWDCYWWNYDENIKQQLRETCEKAACGESSRYDTEVRVAGGETIIIDFMIAPMFDDEGAVTHLIPSGVDITNRKLAEEKLRESKENFRALVEATSQAVWELRNEEEDEVLTKWWSDLTGIPPEQADKWSEAIHPDDRQKVLDHWQKAVATKTLYKVEYRVMDRFGHYRHFAARAIPLFNNDGNFRQWIGTFTDITDQKEIEQALLESETRYRLVAETASDGIVTIDSESKILFVNPAAEQIFGYSKEEMENQDLTMLLPENLRDRHLEGSKRYVATGEKRISWRGVEVPAIRKDGREITIEISFGEYKSEGKHLFTGIIRDITKRKETEEELRKSEERYRLLFKDNPLPMWVYDLETLQFLAVNDAACSHYGYTRQEFLAMTIKDIRPPEDVAALLNDVKATKNNLNLSGVWRHLKKDGSIIFVEINSHIINFDDRPARMVLANDVTERRRTEENIRNLNESLEEKVTERTIKLEAINKELESFSYSVSHDLRAPLRAMDGFSFALLEDYGDRLDEEGKNYLNRIRLASQKMARLIDDMLKLSRVSRGEINRREVNLSALVTEITEQLAETQPKPAINLHIQENVNAFGDEQLLRIALENLLGNAWKFTSKKEVAEISFGEKTIDGEKVFYISDNGAGFDMNYAGKLFGAFQRLHTITEFEGTGIGLATVQRIINRHGGQIWAEGKMDEGASFYFKL